MLGKYDGLEPRPELLRRWDCTRPRELVLGVYTVEARLFELLPVAEEGVEDVPTRERFLGV